MSDLNEIYKTQGEHGAKIEFLVEHAKNSDKRDIEILGEIKKLSEDRIKSQTTWVTVLKTSSAYVTVSTLLIGVYHNFFGG